MSDLLAARSQMAVSLAFHIIFAIIGIAMPVLMVIAERRWQRTRDPVYLDLAKRWARGTAILFAVGAVSGTVLSFELGLLWPRFMETAGPLIGMPFSLEGFAFFTEAIFLGIYLYGWDKVSPRAHLTAGILVAVSGALSGIFVVIANAWMNTPTGYVMVDGVMRGVDPVQAMLTPAAFPQALHMTLAAYAATGLAVAGIHALLLLKNRTSAFNRAALTIGLLVGAPAAILQPVSGDIAARYVARHQPAKLAAMEAVYTTRAGAPLKVIPGVEIPYALSLLAFHDPNAVVKGLDSIPRAEWPNVGAVHISFNVMVLLGTYMALVSVWAAWLVLRKRDLTTRRRFLWALAIATPCGFIATEAGWMVTELGRQPWIIYGIMKTADAVTPMPGLIVPFTAITLLYCALGGIVTWLLYRQIIRSPGA
ncbi:MAG TPA: cytochrome ubiquinol oxidase subunit I [Gemmatimonadales bacterium]|nr:cytochrome ubiquinol oxidase subunit I [Gemmatimonadales bacterium]